MGYGDQRFKILHQVNLQIKDVKKRLMNFFNVGHLITFHNEEGMKLNSSHISKKSQVVSIRLPKLNYRQQTNNKFCVFLKTKGSDKKLLQSFKQAMTKAFSICDESFLNLQVIRLSSKRSKITFEVVKENKFCEIDFKKNYLFMQNKHIKIMPYVHNE